jgi:hypothetical protein
MEAGVVQVIEGVVLVGVPPPAEVELELQPIAALSTPRQSAHPMLRV